MRDRVAHQVVHRQPQPAGPTPDGAESSSTSTTISTAPPGRMFSRATRSSMSVTSMTSRSSACASWPDASWPSAVMIASTRRCARDRSCTTSATLLGGQVVDAQRVQVGAHRGQRGAQLVRGVGGEVLRGLQRVRGGPLRGGQPAQHRASSPRTGPRPRGHRALRASRRCPCPAAWCARSVCAAAGSPGRPAASPGPRRCSTVTTPDRRCRAESWRGSAGCCRRGCRSTSAPRPPGRRGWSAPGTRHR